MLYIQTLYLHDFQVMLFGKIAQKLTLQDTFMKAYIQLEYRLGRTVWKSWYQLLWSVLHLLQHLITLPCVVRGWGCV